MTTYYETDGPIEAADKVRIGQEALRITSDPLFVMAVRQMREDIMERLEMTPLGPEYDGERRGLVAKLVAVKELAETLAFYIRDGKTHSAKGVGARKPS